VNLRLVNQRVGQPQVHAAAREGLEGVGCVHFRFCDVVERWVPALVSPVVVPCDGWSWLVGGVIAWKVSIGPSPMVLLEGCVPS